MPHVRIAKITHNCEQPASWALPD